MTAQTTKKAATSSAKTSKPATKKPAAKKPAAKKTGDSTKQKQAAEKERGKVREKLTNLKREIGKTETEKDKAADTLAKSNEAIESTNRAIDELEKKQSSTEKRFDQLTAERSRLEIIVAEQQNQLAKLLQEHYVSGNEDRMKLLLSGDNPNRINRELQYMTYISEAQAKLMLSLRTNLQTVDDKRAQTEALQQDLEKISQKKQIQKQKLEKEKAQRAILLTQLSSKLEQQKKQAETLQQDEKRLSNLVDNLARKIEAQRKAAAKKRPQEKGRKPQKVESAADAESSKSAFARQRGRMKLPVKGTITAHYGSKRADGPSWKGIFIQTAHGADIRCVANGEVIFADWLRGFGNLIIVDHGAQYMTVYANAQTLRKKAGDNVKGGDVIASAGNSGDNVQTGLYFEMRHNGRAFNPMDWVTTR